MNWKRGTETVSYDRWRWLWRVYHPKHHKQTSKALRKMSVSETCRRVQSFLKSKFQVSNVPVTWIEGCVNCYRNRHSNSNFEALLEFVRSQWLLADFKKLQIRSLPPNLSSVPVVTLSENYLLQVSAFILNNNFLVLLLLIAHPYLSTCRSHIF